MGQYLCKCHQRHSPSERNSLRPLASTIMVTAKVLPAPFSLVPCLIDHVDTWQPGSHCFLTESPYGGYSALPLWEIHLLSIMPFGQNLFKKNQTKPNHTMVPQMFKHSCLVYFLMLGWEGGPELDCQLGCSCIGIFSSVAVRRPPTVVQRSLGSLGRSEV